MGSGMLLLEQEPSFKSCCECGQAAEWASINLGVTLCLECSGAHRSLGVHITKVTEYRLRNRQTNTTLPLFLSPFLSRFIFLGECVHFTLCVTLCAWKAITLLSPNNNNPSTTTTTTTTTTITTTGALSGDGFLADSFAQLHEGQRKRHEQKGESMQRRMSPRLGFRVIGSSRCPPVKVPR